LAVYTYLRDRPERFARWFIYMRDVAVYSYMRNGCVYIRIHSMRDVAVDLYARWCVYIHTCMQDPTFYNIDSFALFELPLHGPNELH